MALALVLGMASVVFGMGTAHATQKFGPLQLSGNVQTLALVRHPDASTLEFVQNRNVARIRIDYDWLQAGKLLNKYDIPFLESSHLFLLWRGVYDSVYDTTPGFLQKEDIHGRAYAPQKDKAGNILYRRNVYQFATEVGNSNTGKKFSGNVLGLSGLSSDERNAFKFENTLREVYADIKFRGLPLTVRAGRQQIVWGETDNFRMLDRANALDLTWHFQQEIPVPAFGWDEIRRPYWMIKFLYYLGDIWRLSQNFLEWYWNPGDWYPAKQAFLPRPWGLPFLDPLTNPVDGVFIGGACDLSRDKVKGPNGKEAGVCHSLLRNTRLFEQGDYARNPLDNSQVGVRYHAMTPQGLEFTLNYFYQRFSGDDGTNYAPLRGLPKDTPTTRLTDLQTNGIFPAEFIAPYVHTVGVSANYSDETFTQSVFRMETIYDVSIPFFDVAKETAIDSPLLPGVTKKNMWKGMIGFDRPTWIRSLNKKSTIFLTGQFFWHYLVNNPDCVIPARYQPKNGPRLGGAQDVAQLGAEGKAAVGSCLVGGLDLPSGARTGTNSDTPAFRDKIRNWETLFTFAAFSFYRGGSVVPVLGLAVDPTNQFSMEPFWNVNWFLSDGFVFNIGQRYFITPRGHSTPIFETWGLAGLNTGRSETTVRLTWQF